jgi:hypothetical protein
MFDGFGETIKTPNCAHVELRATCSPHHPIEFGAGILRAADAAIDELAGDGPAPAMAEVSQLADL